MFLVAILIPTFTKQEFTTDTRRCRGRGVALIIGPDLSRAVLTLVCEHKMSIHDVEKAVVALGRILLLEAPVRHEFFLPGF